MKALLAQLACRIGDVEGNTARAVDAIRSNPDVDIAVFPELYLCGYTYRNLDELARAPDSDEIAAIAAAAAETETAVVIGFAERMSKGVANSAACIDSDGTLAGVYRKTHSSIPKRRRVSSRARSSSSSSWRAGGPPRSSASTSSSRSREAGRHGRSRRPRHRLREHGSVLHRPRGRAVARAHENRLPHLYANLVGSGDGLTFVGASRSIAPTGEILVEASRDQEELLVVPVAELGGFDPRTDYPSSSVRPAGHSPREGARCPLKAHYPFSPGGMPHG